MYARCFAVLLSVIAFAVSILIICPSSFAGELAEDYVDDEVPALAEKVFKRAQYPTLCLNNKTVMCKA